MQVNTVDDGWVIFSIDLHANHIIMVQWTLMENHSRMIIPFFVLSSNLDVVFLDKDEWFSVPMVGVPPSMTFRHFHYTNFYGIFLEICASIFTNQL